MEVEPDAFEDHTRWDSCMHGLPRDVVFRVGVLSCTVEDKSLLLLILVIECHLNMKLLLVEHLDLEAQEGLQEE